MQTDPAPPPTRYHYEWLALAHTILKLSNHYIINPRNIYAESLFDADEDWIAEFGNYLQDLDYTRDSRKQKQAVQQLLQGHNVMDRT